ncbi:YbaY family lipoprotein [Colwelliaceae bacterium BS250]
MNNRLKRLCLSVLIFLTLNACDSASVTPDTSTKTNTQILEGKVYYRERILLPPGAVLEVTLEDVSKMDVASVLISSVKQPLKGAPPYTFNLDYNAELIKPNMRYGLRAKVTLSNKLLMTSTEHLDPFRSSQDNINIKLSSVAHNQSQNSTQETLAVVSVNPLATLSNTYWKLLKLNGEAVNMSDQQKREAFIQFTDGQNIIKGFASCNNFQGSFVDNGNDLSFGKIAVMQMSCLKGMDVESKFLQVLELTTYYSIHQHELTLLDNNKKPIARFQAQYFN